MASDAGTVELLVEELGRAFANLQEIFQPSEFADLLMSLGIDDPPDLGGDGSFTDKLEDVTGAAAGIQVDLDNLRLAIDEERLSDAVASAAKILATVGVINLNLDVVGADLPRASAGHPSAPQIAVLSPVFTERVIGEVVARHLEFAHPLLENVLRLLGIIERSVFVLAVGEDSLAFPRRRLFLDRIPDLLTDPIASLDDTYRWGQTDFRSKPLLQNVADFFNTLGLYVGGVGDGDREVPLDLDDPDVPAEIDFFKLTFEQSDDAVPGLEATLHVDIGDNQQIELGRVGDDWRLVFELGGSYQTGLVAKLLPPFSLDFEPPPGGVLAGHIGLQFIGESPLPDGRIEVFSISSGCKIDAQSVTAGLLAELVFDAAANRATADLDFRFHVQGGRVVVRQDPGENDGLLSKLLPEQGVELAFDVALRWSRTKGLRIEGSAGLELVIPLHRAFGPIAIELLALKAKVDEQTLSFGAGVSGTAKLGPVTLAVDDVGVLLDVDFSSRGSLAAADLDVRFKPPTGLGISVNAGAISGGGFLKFEPDVGRYSGAIQLSIYSVSVGAFGIIETRFPDGRSGFSFVIVISAEFPGIQLGFGFTLLGVGGIIGINRGLDANELGRLVLAGESGHLLFPKDVVANAPAIIRDLGTVFPAREGRYVFGPLAKLGWGTPTLIRGELGLILELPGPTLTILGEVRVRLPKEELALASFNLSVLGFLDFPRKSFGLDAALHDSIINGYPVSGQMAMRVRWGEEPNFVLSVGGFHPAYKPPPGFPKLQPLTLDLGKSDSVSVTVSGFFAVTSNTLQIGGDARLHASGSGISLDATLGVKALFIFTPFSFEAIIDASVKISFHGRGPSVHLHGVLSGPTPWRARGELCVSILFWDACLGFDETFGGGEPQSVPAIDPWTGSAGPPEVIGLEQALDDPASWSTEPPPGALSVVTLAEGSKNLVDPLGVLIVRERIVPVETPVPIERFGVAKVPEPIMFKLLSATLQGSVPLVKRGTVEDSFAPAQYFELDDAKKLSAKSYEKREAGYRLAANDRDLQLGSKVSFEPAFETLVVAADGSATSAAPYVPTEAHVNGSTTRSAVALFGTLQLGMRRYIDPRSTRLFALPAPTFQLAHVATLFGSSTAPPAASRTEALLLYAAFIRAQPEQRGRFQVVASHEIRGI